MIAKTPDSQEVEQLVTQISEELRQLSNDKLITVREFVAFLASRADDDICLDCLVTPREITLASEAALKKLWDSPEEDAAWAHL
jgi:hypothetical protein